MWTIEVWLSEGARKGRWLRSGRASDPEGAEVQVRSLMQQGKHARALQDGPDLGGLRGMEGSPHTGFCRWTGSGGQI